MVENENSKRRDPEKERYWLHTMREWQKSGLKVRDFCQRQDISETKFYWWRGELKRRKKKNTFCAGQEKKGTSLEESGNPFIPVRVVGFIPGKKSSPQEDSGIEIEVTGGQRIIVKTGFDPETLTSVIEALESRTC